MATALAGVKNKFDVGDAAHAAVVGGKNTAQIAQVVSTFFATSIDLTTSLRSVSCSATWLLSHC